MLLGRGVGCRGAGGGGVLVVRGELRALVLQRLDVADELVEGGERGGEVLPVLDRPAVQVGNCLREELRDEGGPRKGAKRPGPPPLSCSVSCVS